MTFPLIIKALSKTLQIMEVVFHCRLLDGSVCHCELVPPVVDGLPHFPKTSFLPLTTITLA